MTNSEARAIAENITNEQLKEMFDKARKGIKDWTVVSICNNGLTKGLAWNILAKDFDVNHTYHIMAKKNMIREFGIFLPEELQPKKKPKKFLPPPAHQEPIFDNYDKD